ncbi:CbiQ family ECF transporter T component [Treponema sp.]|uniref:CbiQ family ECF transporter T component n=1 Tax=Treponema sp. TaxID=166 RepID=UPI003F0D8B4C
MALSLFSYRKGTSVIHRLPPAVKLCALFILCIFVYSGGTSVSWEELFSTGIALRILGFLALGFAAFFLSGAKWNSLLQLKFVFVIGGFVTLLKLADIPFRLNKDALAYGILYTARFFITSLAAQIVFETTSPLQIQNTLEHLQSGIAKIIPQIARLNPALTVSLAINFIPEIFSTWSRVELAVKARMPGKSKASIRILSQQLTTFLSCLLHSAEIKRMAVLNRSAR